MKEETRKMLEKAQAGDAEAQYLTGLYYEDKGDVNEAFLWYDRSATQGFVYGINAVAIYYLKGMAVERDTGRAIALLESIAEKEPTAKANLGHIYLEGQGCPYRKASGYSGRLRIQVTDCRLSQWDIYASKVCLELP